MRTIAIPDATGSNLSPLATLVFGMVCALGLAIPYPVETQRGEASTGKGQKQLFLNHQIVPGTI
jgi:hypothetical protein